MFLRKGLIFIIEIYQSSLSKLFLPACRYYPSCSEYAKQALSKFTLFKALGKIFLRILRCNPFFPGGYDPLT
ncbi:MAG TPA: membrane protein insertion efficiency factor YidD [Candidatus Omnitrophica bacterium]|nr:MAG: membrane protein insertion efficiency factor YidD [Candidatus Omnitrophota bacterium]RKY35820.1 MAG: membrane protein insertion efficiency factor YidD [Candidatus Omnitrophota bacterium]RKY44640.1 MAG: membrane protein insertion efficiency factor YidD [Candidatus Omnitrophota bacterium]HEC70143.1 membrane protein insertion efficiency factor YidD [Candidatus Omnitrophota bacterium]